jgi:hypothetical protein
LGTQQQGKIEHHRSRGRRRRPGNLTPQKTKNSIEDLVGNEEIEYSVPDPKQTMINITNELSDTPKKNLSRRKLWMRPLRNS